MSENVPDPARPPRPRHVVDGDDFEADLDDDPPVAAPGHQPPAPVVPERAAPAQVGAAPAPPQQKKRRPFWIELPILILIAFGLTFLIQTFIAKVYYVPSGSMEQTLHGVASGGDRILANKVVYDIRDPAQGDVVVFAGPPSWAPEARIAEPTSWIGSALQSLGSVVGIAPPNEKDYVKRVIAVGGQTVQCCDAQGAVTVDGRSLVEPYIYEPIEFAPGELDCSTSPMSRRCFGPVTIPAGQLWVMGDHRSDSADSSYQCQGFAPGSGAQCQGPVPVDNVIGKAVFIVMPPSRWGTIGDPEIDPGNQNADQSALSAAATMGAPGALGLLTAVGLRGAVVIRRKRRR